MMESGGFHGWNLADFMAVESGGFHGSDIQQISRWNLADFIKLGRFHA